MEYQISPFWQRQPLLPIEIQRFLRKRFDLAIRKPEDRQHLVWALILGSPGIQKSFTDGIPTEEIYLQAAKMLASVDIQDPRKAWDQHQLLFSDTAINENKKWLPHPSWRPWAQMISLRSGWQLSSLTGIHPGSDYLFECGVSLFNNALFFECHDALEPLWLSAKHEEKSNLQLLILITAGFHHIQQHNAPGAQSVWKDALSRLKGQKRVNLQSGNVDISEALCVLESIIPNLDSSLDGVFDWGKIWQQTKPLWIMA